MRDRSRPFPGNLREQKRCQQFLEHEWAALRLGEVKVETKDEQYLFEVQVYRNDLDPNAARVELYADGVNGDGPVRQEMKRVRRLVSTASAYAYRVSLPRHARLPTIRCE